MLIFYDLLNEQPLRAVFGVLKSVSFAQNDFIFRPRTRNDVLIVEIPTENINVSSQKLDSNLVE